MFVTIRGRRMYPWRAVDAEGEVLDFLIQSRRNKAAAHNLMRRLLKSQGFAPTAIVTDKLGSYGAAFAEHVAIVEAIERRDPDAAEEATIKHIRASERVRLKREFGVGE